MSFSSDIKREISRIGNTQDSSKLAELSALLLTCGRIVLKGHMRLEVVVVTTENNVAHKIIELVKALYSISVDICVSRNMRLKKGNKYILTFYDSTSVRKLLEDTTILCYDNEGFCYINHKGWEKLLMTDECQNAFLRGVFAGSGSVNDPAKHNHMEYVLYDVDFAEAFAQYLNSRNIKCNMIERKSFYVVYLKDAECIVDVLRAIGASTALFNYENIRIKKTLKNIVVRKVNCEMANQNKTIDAGIAQKNNIEYIFSKKGKNFLPPNLQYVAEIRLNNSDMSLAEIGEMLDPPIGKSGVNHRMKKIEQIANELRTEYGD